LALQSTAASILGSAHDRVVGSTFQVGPNQTIKRGQLRVAKSPKPSPDKYYTVKYLESYLRSTLEQASVGLDSKEIAAILRREQREKLLGIDSLIAGVVDSPLDVDRMDYLIRDAQMTGLSMGFTNIMALIDRMRPYRLDKQFLLTYHHSAVPYIEHFLYARDAMFINCYEHFR
jgi:HD superfamily phosphohydrolase